MHEVAESPVARADRATRGTRGTRAAAIAAWLVAAISVGTMLTHSWVPLDEGTIALSARNVAAGYLPHADFAYPYTGGLAFLHAAAFRLVGDTLAASRYALFTCWLLWLPAVWGLTRRFGSATAAAVVVVLCAWWSVLVYPAAMPTWYLLFLATWSVAALVRWHDSGRIAWVVVAGLAAGAAIVVKQTGLATLVGAGLGVLAVHQHRRRHVRDGHGFGVDGDVGPDALSGGASPDRLVLVLLAVAALVPLGIFVRRGLFSGEALTIALPILAVLVALAVREREAGRDGAANEVGDFAAGRRQLLRAWGALLVGAAIAPTALLAIYLVRGALPALIEANTAGTLRTVNTIAEAMPSAETMLAYAVPVWLVAVAFGVLRPSRLSSAAAVAAAVGGGVLAMQFTTVYLGIWNAAQLLVPVCAVAVAMRWDRQRGAGSAATTAAPTASVGPSVPSVPSVPSDPVIVALAAAMALQTINQLPYGAPNYFAYVAPLALVLGGALAARIGNVRRMLYAAALLLAFGGWFNRIGFVGTAGRGPVWWDDAHALPGVHGGLMVTATDSVRFARLTELVAEHGGADRFVAGPELSALYVLAGTRRLVAQPYLLAPDALADSAAIAAAVDTTAIRAVAINHAPTFLPTASASALAWLVRTYPHAERVQEVEFRWR